MKWWAVLKGGGVGGTRLHVARRSEGFGGRACVAGAAVPAFVEVTIGSLDGSIEG